MYKAILFDLDGTLLNTLEDLCDSMNRVLSSRGFPVHPLESCRYFVGEGAAVVVIEDEEYAKERGARIYARVNGIGNHFEAFKMGKYHPDAAGLKESIRDAMKNSELDVSEIDYIGASANSVPEHDRLETKAIKEVSRS